MARRELRAVRLRPEVVLEETPAPQRLAAVRARPQADVVVDDEELATGRFVLLHDPAGPEAWEGDLPRRHLRAGRLEPEIAADPLLTQVGWSWLRSR